MLTPEQTNRLELSRRAQDAAHANNVAFVLSFAAIGAIELLIFVASLFVR